jgi:hypothetical protein
MQRFLFGSLLAISFSGTALAYSGEAFTVCRLDPDGDNFLALREGPNSKSRILAKLGPATFLESQDFKDTNGFRPVIVLKGPTDWHPAGKRPTGWVYSKFICVYEGSVG